MTMFSMKPQFDLAQFLAEPTAQGSRNKRGAFSRKTTAPAKLEPEVDEAVQRADT